MSYRHFKQEIAHFSSFLRTCNAQEAGVLEVGAGEAHIQLRVTVLHGQFALFTVKSNFWYQIYQNQKQLMALIT